MVERVDDLLVMQPRVGRVQHGADARYRVEQFQMPVRVPGQRADGAAGVDAELAQRLRGLACAHGEAGIVVAPQRLVDPARSEERRGGTEGVSTCRYRWAA